MRIELSRLDKSSVLKLALIIEMIDPLSAAAAISRGNQDSWILEGLEVPFAVIMVTYLVYSSAERNPTWLIAFALIIRFTVLSLHAHKMAFL